MAWGKLGSDDGDGSTTDVTVEFTATTFLHNIFYLEGSSSAVQYFRYGSSSTPDSANNYASRNSSNGGTDSTFVTTESSLIQDNYNEGTVPALWITYGINIAGEEKLMILFRSFQNTAGAGNAPARHELVGKWVNTSNQADVFEISRASGNWTTSSNLSVLGSEGQTPTSATIQDGLIFEETDTNKHYIYDSSTDTWTEI